MVARTRQRKIVQLINKRHGISVKELSELLGVSLNTIRTDIDIIVKDNPNIQKTHGGIILLTEPEIDIRYTHSHSEKLHISRILLTHLLKYDNPTIFIDSSTTTYTCIKSFIKTQKKITLITNAVDILLEIKNNPNISVIGCGGMWWSSEHCFIGHQVEKELQQYQVDIALIGVSGIIKDKGLFNGNIETTKIKQIMSEHSKETWVVAENSKFDTEALVKFLDFSSVTKFFTEKRLSNEWENRFEKEGIQYFY